MKPNIEAIISKELKKNRRISSDMLASLAGISRQAAHKRLSLMVDHKGLVRIGSTRGSYYEKYSLEKERKIKRTAKPVSLRLRNKGLEEHLVLERLERQIPGLRALTESARHIFSYAFTEMLNNAIEHSRSEWINVSIYQDKSMICFDVVDQGVGVYNNLMKKFKVKTELEAIQELLKGKRTTAPKKHSGEGIFFTEKISDVFELEGGKSALVIDNARNDIAVKEIDKRKGTKVLFKINGKSRKNLTKLFNEYTDEEYKFSKTRVLVKLYEKGVDYVSRSQARRVLYGLEKFKTIVLDFDKIKGIGQGFADEVFRLYSREHPEVKILPRNASKTVMFMINRAQ